MVSPDLFRKLTEKRHDVPVEPADRASRDYGDLGSVVRVRYLGRRPRLRTRDNIADYGPLARL